MKGRIMTWNTFGKYPLNNLSVINSFSYNIVNDDNNTYSIIANTSPHSKLLETGVRRHLVNVNRYPALRAWVDAVFDERSIYIDYLMVGDINSNIREGDSQRKFWSEGISIYVNTEQQRVANEFRYEINRQTQRAFKW